MAYCYNFECVCRATPIRAVILHMSNGLYDSIEFWLFYTATFNINTHEMRNTYTHANAYLNAIIEN